MAAAFRFPDLEEVEGWVPESSVEIAAELPLLPGVIDAAEWPLLPGIMGLPIEIAAELPLLLGVIDAAEWLLLPGVIGDPISIVGDAIFIAITIMK